MSSTPAQGRGASVRRCVGASRPVRSARETLSFGYVHEDTELDDPLNHIVGTLVRLVRV